MRSSLYIKELTLEAFVGAYEHEKIAKQPILIDLTLLVDSSEGIRSDSLKDVLDYTKVAEVCQQVVDVGHYHLIEALAATLTEKIFATFSLKGIRVELKKPHALATACFVAVIMEKGERCNGS